jgi:hypothetical protein
MLDSKHDCCALVIKSENQTMPYRILPGIFLVFATVWVAHAQPADELTPLREQAELTEQDRNTVREFVSTRVRQIVGDDALARADATRQLRAGFAGGEAFKRAYGEAAIEIIGSAFRKADLLPATRLLATLSVFELPASRGVFLDALKDERVAVRAAGAIGLRRLRAALATAGGEAFTGTIAALREAASAERSSDTLRTIYAAMDYAQIPGTPDQKVPALAVLAVLDQRGRLYREGEVPALGADDAGLMVAARYLEGYDADQRRQLTVAAASMVKRAIEAYKRQKLYEVENRGSNREIIEYRDAMERLVLIGETQLLSKLLSPPKPEPSVYDKMRRVDMPGMTLEWKDRWVELLRNAVNQDFSIEALPESEASAGGE